MGARDTASYQTEALVAVNGTHTGPSSLSYLQHCPVDVLKIDQSFVREIMPTPEGAPLVRAVIAMGKGLGCRVVAEGVETRQQFAFVRAELCRVPANRGAAWWR